MMQSRGWMILGLLVLALFSRGVKLGDRPVMHDESLFAHAAYEAMNEGYRHDPMLHGPVLLLITGQVFSWLGDDIAVARGLIGLFSIFLLIAAMAWLPHTQRPVFLLLLIVSPVLLFYSRLFRNDLLFCSVLMMAQTCWLMGVWSLRHRGIWISVGVALGWLLLGIKENALFVYAAWLTFAILVAGMTWIRHRNEFMPTFKSFVPGVVAGTVIGMALLVLVYGVFVEPSVSIVGESASGWTRFWVLSGFANLAENWRFWSAEHSGYRLAGEVHYYLPILLVYELPLVVLIGWGLVRHGLTQRRRGWVYILSLVGWTLIWGVGRIWQEVGLPVPDAISWLGSALHLTPSISLLLLGYLIVPLLVWSIAMVWQGRWVPAWLGWWAACSMFQYAVAGEKVPWLAVHIVLPLYFVAGWLCDDIWREGKSWSRRGLVVVLVAGVLFGGVQSVRWFGPGSSDPRERLVYNHTTVVWHDAVMDILRDESDAPKRILFVTFSEDDGGALWPGAWMFRQHDVHETAHPGIHRFQPWDVVMTPTPLPETWLAASRRTWTVQLVDFRGHWDADWPTERPVQAWWRYVWYREPWSAPTMIPVYIYVADASE